MDLINEIELFKYDTLDNLYTILPPTLFANTIDLPRSVRHTLCGLFKKLERLIHNANTHWWDNFFLKKYVSSNISPRGLRVLTSCSFLDPTHLKDWQGIAEFCTAKFLGVLIKQRLIKYDETVHHIQILIQEVISHDQKVPGSWLEILKKNTKRKEDLLITTKLGKFKRDLDDYQKDKIFSWKHHKHVPALLDLPCHPPRNHLATSPVPLPPPKPLRIAYGRNKPNHPPSGRPPHHQTNINIDKNTKNNMNNGKEKTSSSNHQHSSTRSPATAGSTSNHHVPSTSVPPTTCLSPTNSPSSLVPVPGGSPGIAPIHHPILIGDFKQGDIPTPSHPTSISFLGMGPPRKQRQKRKHIDEGAGVDVEPNQIQTKFRKL